MDASSSDSDRQLARRRRRGHRGRQTRQSPLVEAVSSLGGFLFGLFLSSVYGCTALFLQNAGFWYGLITTIIIAAFCAFGMGLSIRVRSTVLLMLPMLCCKNGKNTLLFVTFSLVAQGPLANTVENFRRAAGSVSCGAELAANQTRRVLDQALAPLLPVLGKIREISRNAYAVAGRVQNFMSALTDSVRHVARTLRNVLHFLVDIGEVCNDKLGTPHRKCIKLFDEAHSSCKELLNIFSFLCDVVTGFQPLCNLTKVTELFCAIPSYVMDQLKLRLAEPTIAAFEKMRREFDFNISASMILDTHLNTSQSVHQVSQNIMEEVTTKVSRLHDLTGLLGYARLFFLLLTYLQAVWYKKKYLGEDDFDNIYITDLFVEMDLKRSREGRSSLLPLSRREALTYIRPSSPRLTEQERRAAVLNTVSVLRHAILGGLLVALDLVVFWVFDVVHHLAQGEIVTRAPVMVAVQVNGSGYASDIFKDIVAAFDVLQKGNITVLSKKCLNEPLEPDNNTLVFIGFLYGLSLFIAVGGGYIRRFRRLVCASYYPKRERERIRFLYNHILGQRTSLKKALLSVARRSADGEPKSLLRRLAACLPGLSYVTKWFGAPEVSCMVCGKTAKTMDDPTMSPCSTPKCTGLSCVQCYRSMNCICPVCMRPLTFQEDSEEEIDSSDDQQVALWSAALSSMPRSSEGADMRKLLRRRIVEAVRRRRLRQKGAEGASDSDSNISIQSSSTTSEADMAYQDQPVWDNSESSDHDPQPFLDACMSCKQGTDMSGSDSSFSSSQDSVPRQEDRLHTVIVHSPMTHVPSVKTEEVQPTLHV